MTAPTRNRRPAATRKGAGLCALALLLALAGCKSKDGGGTASKGSDPLLAGPGRIPRQNLPVPDRGTAGGGKGRVDPLLGSPTGRSPDRIGYSSDPSRWKNGPYTPTADASPAALAGRQKDDGDTLKIDSPGGVPLTTVGGPVAGGPDAPVAGTAPPGELAKYGVKRGDTSLTRDGGQYVFRVKVAEVADGPNRGYEGRGATEAEAVRQVLDQLKAGRK